MAECNVAPRARAILTHPASQRRRSCRELTGSHGIHGFLSLVSGFPTGLLIELCHSHSVAERPAIRRCPVWDSVSDRECFATA